MYGLGGIHGRAAADGDDAVRAGSLERFDAVLHVLDGGVGLDVGVDFVRVLVDVQQGGDLAGDAELDEVGVGADEGFFVAAGVELGQDVRDGAMAMVGNGVEDDTAYHRAFLLCVVVRHGPGARCLVTCSIPRRGRHGQWI